MMQQNTSEPADSIDRCYELLNITKDASSAQVREAYIRMRHTFNGQNQALYSIYDEQETTLVLEQIERAFRTINESMHAPEAIRKAPKCEDGREPETRPDHNYTPRPVVKGVAIRASSARKEDILQKMKDLIEGGDKSDGALYKQLRELANVSEQEMQERTKVCIEYIRAIESNSLEPLPKAIFVKGFLRSYFRYLSAPCAEQMVEAFAEKMNPQPPV